MPLTNAQKQARHRTRKAEKMRVMEEALREIIELADKHSTDSGLQCAAIISEHGLGL